MKFGAQILGDVLPLPAFRYLKPIMQPVVVEKKPTLMDIYLNALAGITNAVRHPNLKTISLIDVELVVGEANDNARYPWRLMAMPNAYTFAKRPLCLLSGDSLFCPNPLDIENYVSQVVSRLNAAAHADKGAKQ